MNRQVLVAFSVVAIVVLMGASFFGGRWYEQRVTVPPEPSGPIAISSVGPGRYIALGDSYSAGEGLYPWEQGTQNVKDGGDRCHRSREFAYPLRLTFSEDVATEFRACSGAKWRHLYDETQSHDGEPNRLGLQVQPGIHDDVVLVTMTMGGNDLDFAGVLQFCFDRTNCEEAPYKDSLSLREWASKNIGQLRADLVPIYQNLRRSFPNARLLVLGYPALFPEEAPPATRIESAVCNVLFEAWTASERDAIRQWGGDLNTAIQGAIQQANDRLDPSRAVEFVEVFSHFTGHEPCTTKGEWVRFVGVSTASAIRDGSFHPLRRGHTMLARIVSCHLAVFPTSDTRATATTGYAMTGCVARETSLLHEPAIPTTPPEP